MFDFFQQESFLDKVIFGNTVLRYLVSIGMFLVPAVLLFVLNKFVVSRIKKWISKSSWKLDDFAVDVFEKIVYPLIYAGLFFLAFNNLSVAGQYKALVNKTGIILVTIFAIRAVIMVLNFMIVKVAVKGEDDEIRAKSMKGIMGLIKMVIWIIGIILVLDNLGYKVSAVVAGLGIGGIAVALAAQAVLGDLFSYISIMFDKPFKIGDFIIFDDVMGTVENVGIKTTRISSLSGEEIVVSNSALTNSKVKNYKKMVTRRVLFKLGVVYGTPKEKLEKIPVIIGGIITAISGARFDRAHFSAYGDFSLNFEVVYYVEGNDYNKYMDINQEINFKIYEAFEKEGIEFAYPTQTLYVKK
ncbi:MAG: mechanosensitive ion channel protein MscS [Candidatus Goldiibacteriota bacterium HGW-Goldbacteria-1]|jgi:small-conductance mechanosensitive channel|nr:MAG: mechanosensitive ion channel protein MscS [Candidatus Goldiibacteriota bacterium HGW-Goldbacteria-1]